MRVTLEREGNRATVEVSRDLTEVRVAERTFPVRVVHSGPLGVELEIAGERVRIDEWPEHFPTPPAPVAVLGMLWTVRVERSEEGGGPAAAAAGPVPSAPAGSPSPARPPAPAGAAAIASPMPGRVIEVRVREGQHVRAGEALLVVEAMKMRNELVSPTDGVVREVRVVPGANVRAREPMLFVAPE
jgi:glutaconyl-CoA/methylmalonyl-CoA decarboxylase subunit gamma